jgi:hypothetical protein
MKMAPKPKKWITWELPQKFLDGCNGEEENSLADTLRNEVNKALEDMIGGLPVSFKVTNLPKEY